MPKIEESESESKVLCSDSTALAIKQLDKVILGKKSSKLDQRESQKLTENLTYHFRRYYEVAGG